MSTKIKQKPSQVNSNEAKEKVPLIFITRFNGDYYDYAFELQVNGMYAIAVPCDIPSCHCMCFGAEEENLQAIEALDPFIRAYITHFLDSRHFDAFDEPLSTGAFRGEHTQFEVLDYEYKDNVHINKLLVNGAYVEVTKEKGSDDLIIHGNGNTAYLEKVSQEIRDFVKPILDSFEEDELK